MIKWMGLAAGLTALAACGSSAAEAPGNAAGEATTEASAQTLFECQVDGKPVHVAAAGDRLTFRHGSADAPDAAVTGTVADGNVFYLSQRFAGMQYQLRFTDGETSYLVYSLEGNPNAGAQASSGLVVMRGTEQVSEASCDTHTEFSAEFDYSALPQDDETFSAI